MLATKREVIEWLEEKYRLDMLCEQCGGLIEIERNTTCRACAIKGDARIALEWIDTHLASLRGTFGLRPVPIKHRQNSVDYVDTTDTDL